MNGPTEIRFAPAVTEMRAFLEPFRPWIESALGAPLDEALTFELEVPFGELVAEDLLAGTPLDRKCLARGDCLRPLVERWELPPGASARIHLYPSRDRRALVTAGELAWDPHWKETPVAVWLRGLRHALVVMDVPYVSYQHGLVSSMQSWLLANRQEAPAALGLLRPALRVSRKTVEVIGGEPIPLPESGYDWNSVVLDQTLTRLVREDFEGFLAREAWFRRHRLPFRRGYFLYGPPGNGKTTIVRVMALHPAITAYALNFSNEELNNGDLTQLFEMASSNAPALMIFEDLDRLYGLDRLQGKGVNPDNLTKITLQHLLNSLDGVAQHDGVIVVATANDPAMVDPAILRRPGRFDRVLACSLPTPDLRREYLRRLSVDGTGGDGLDRLAARMDGFSFAQVREAFILAGQLAYQRGVDAIGGEDLLEAADLLRGEAQALRNRSDGRGVGFELSGRGV